MRKGSPCFSVQYRVKGRSSILKRSRAVDSEGPKCLPLGALKTRVNIKFLSLLAVVWMAGCAEVCDEPPIDDLNALYLELKVDGDDGFSEDERASCFIVRYFDVVNDSLTFPDDTVFYNGNFHDGSDNRIRLSNGTPFENDSLFYVRYNYGIFFESDSTLELLITDIDLRSRYVGECGYENVQKTFRLNGEWVDRSGSQAYYEITK